MFIRHLLFYARLVHRMSLCRVFEFPDILQWRHYERNGVSNHQPHDCLLNRLLMRRSKKTPKPSVAGLCEGISPVTGEFPATMASNAENVSIWWHHHAFCLVKLSFSLTLYFFTRALMSLLPVISSHGIYLVLPLYYDFSIKKMNWNTLWIFDITQLYLSAWYRRRCCCLAGCPFLLTHDILCDQSRNCPFFTLYKLIGHWRKLCKQQYQTQFLEICL